MRCIMSTLNGQSKAYPQPVPLLFSTLSVAPRQQPLTLSVHGERKPKSKDRGRARDSSCPFSEISREPFISFLSLYHHPNHNSLSVVILRGGTPGSIIEI
jgi:hypothetical protein